MRQRQQLLRMKIAPDKKKGHSEGALSPRFLLRLLEELQGAGRVNVQLYEAVVRELRPMVSKLVR